MQFLDKAKIYLASGAGGNGCISFRREKNIEFGGPNGGNGGRGGHIILKTDKNLNTLIDFRYRQHFYASSGKHGSGKEKTGHAGEDLVIALPIGTEVWDVEKKELLVDLTEENQEVVLLKGGRGGLGNTHFKSSTNRSPKFALPGEAGENLCVELRLKLLADVGLIGLPNAGKSTLLSVLTKAHPKIADYPFTTLYPQLGLLRFDHHDVILADLPGLIEGAHTGKGLGTRFLGHAERCRVLLHLIDIHQEDPLQSYRSIRHELQHYDKKLFEKPELVVLTKSDLMTQENLKDWAEVFMKETQKQVMYISSKTHQGLEELKRRIFSLF